MTEAYERHKEGARARSAEISRAGRELGELPPVENPARRAACERNFRLFCETYFPRAFRLAWSAGHLEVIEAIQAAVLEGGLFAFAMPRGSGKTTLAERAVIWALVFGHRRYVLLVCASDSKAKRRLRTIKTELETNPLLLADFPEVCHPIHRLERQTSKARGQTYKGEPTRIVWSEDEIVLPTVAGSKAAGAIAQAGGITGEVRGAVYLQPDGTQIRPDLCLGDDPQTRESAKSPEQTKTREDILTADLLGTSGPDVQMAMLVTVTVIYQGDLADRLLNRELHPDYRGVRLRTLDAMPANMELWEQYDAVRRECLQTSNKFVAATSFYKKNKKAMDEGAVVNWPERKKAGEISGLQSAMNWYFRSPEGFASEGQNEPVPLVGGQVEELTADEIAAKIAAYAAGVVPLGCTVVAGHIDVHNDVLYYWISAAEPDFTAYEVDYGAFPDQGRGYFAKSDARRTLKKQYPGRGQEGWIRAGLDELVNLLMSFQWMREDGAPMRIERLLVDAGWFRDLVYQFCRESPHAGVLTPSHGKYVGAASKPFAEYARKRGDRIGPGWRQPRVERRGEVRHVTFDTNHWKSFGHARLATAAGDRGCYTLHKAKPDAHRMAGEHLSAEYRTRTEGRGRTVDEWQMRPGMSDNHLGDTFVASLVALSMQGITLPENKGAHAQSRRRVRRKVKLSELGRGGQ